MKYFSLFSGIGGFELGIKQAYENHLKFKHISEESESKARKQGRKRTINERGKKLRPADELASLCVGFSEIDKYAVQIYQSHFDHKNYGDIKKIDERRLPNFELLCGGFPCQSFSIAGKRGGFEDTRGTLFFDIARIAKAKRPRLLLLENVKGLLSHEGGRTFNTIIAVLDELGYDIQWEVLNSKDFGVPQNRERVFIVGHLRGTPRPQVFPFGESNSNPVPGNKKGEDRIADTITTRYAGRNGRGTRIKQLNQPRHSNDRIYGLDGIAPTLNTMQGGRRQPKIRVNSSQDGKLSPLDGVAFTLSAGHYNQPKIGVDIANAVTPDAYLATGERKRVGGKAVLTSMHERRIRRLTPKECERLQGFPDDWTKWGGSERSTISDTQRYKCCGNAVTVNVIEAIITKLI